MSFGISRSSSNSKRTRLSSVNGAFRTSNVGGGGGSGGGSYATGGAMHDDGQEDRIGSLETTVGGHVSRIGAAESTIATHGTVVTRNIASGLPSQIANTDIYDVAYVNQVLAAAEVVADTKFAAKQNLLTTSSVINIARTTYESTSAGDAAITANAAQSIVNNFRLTNCKLLESVGDVLTVESTNGGDGQIKANVAKAQLENFKLVNCVLGTGSIVYDADYLDIEASGGGMAGGYTAPVGVGRIGASKAAYLDNFRMTNCKLIYQDIFTVQTYGTTSQADGQIKAANAMAELVNFKLVNCVIANGGAITSDDRLKHNESSISNALDTINKLNPQKYYQTLEMLPDDHTIDFDAPDIPEGKWLCGFIAQEVAEIPELKHLVDVPDTPELEYTMNYNSVHAYAIKAIQELLAKNIALEARVAALENK